MILIPLTQGLFAKIDDWNYERINQYKWFACKEGNYYYAKRNLTLSNGKQKGIYMHRIVMNTPKHLVNDHIDFDGLNNQESNLRSCTKSQNSIHRKGRGKSKYRGVYYRGNSINCQIFVNGKIMSLGIFKTEEEAARAYDVAAKKYHKGFAVLNFN